MKQWDFGADDIVAVVAKTEGNGGVNDISRILVDRVLRDFFVARGSRTREQALRYLASRVGTERIVLGSDDSFPPADRDPLASLRAADFGVADIERITERNPRELFRI